MKTKKTTRPRSHGNRQSGIALLIAMFILLLISAVALSMLFAAGTESALFGNYHSSSRAYYAGLAGLEEARGRMVPSNPNYFDNTNATFLPPLGTPMTVGQVDYVLNPLPNEIVAPTNLTSTTTYPDNEYQQEFGVAVTSATVQTITSVSGTNTSNIPGPLYKWVRINPITEGSLNVDVDGNGIIDRITPLYYDSQHVPSPSLVNPSTTALSSSALQAFEVTSLAVLPDGSERMAQYVVAAQTFGLNFPSALTMAGPVGAFQGAASSQFAINGGDGSGNAPAVPGCAPSTASLPAIGTTDTSGQTTNKTTVTNGIPSNRTGNYTGAGLATPSVSDVSLTAPFDSPADLNTVLQEIQQNATALVPNPPPTGVNSNTYSFSNVVSALGGTWSNSSTNPQVVYVDGNFDLGPNTGSGILVVTGNFTYSGNSGWNGIILVVGDGTTTFNGNGGGTGQFDGALLVATTRSSTGQPLSTFGQTNFDISGGGGNGVYYNSCWVSNSQRPTNFKVLSFKEIPYTD